LFKNVDYLSATSGGSWATAVFSYGSNEDDSISLGPILAPEQFSHEALSSMESQCFRRLVHPTWEDQAKIINEVYGGKNGFDDAWAEMVQRFYLTPVGIKSQKFIVANQEQMESVMRRVKYLNADDFVQCKPDRPLPIIGWSTIGARSFLAPKLAMLEMSPLCTGSYQTSLDATKLESIPVAGMTETAYSRSIEGQGLDLRKAVPDVKYFTSMSSWFPALFMTHLPVVNKALDFQMIHSYLSPLTPPEAGVKPAPFLMCDGGCLDNLMLIPMVQRRVDKVVVLVNTITPLLRRKFWKLKKDSEEIDYNNCLKWYGPAIATDLSSCFGVRPDDELGVDYSRNHVFQNQDFPPLVDRLHAAQQSGNGIIATIQVTTIDNIHWGITAGFVMELTVVYLGKVKEWVRRLPPNFPFEDTMNPKIDPSYVYPNLSFPSFSTRFASMNYQQANALSNLTGWTILRNRVHFERVLSGLDASCSVLPPPVEVDPFPRRE
jgi:hypothetical protein